MPKSDRAIPKFNPQDLYVYFNSLTENSSRHPGINAMKANVYKQAHSHFYSQVFSPLQGNYQTSETIGQALSFLNNVASNERSKELNLIENYIKEIENAIPPELRDGKDMKTILNELRETSQDLKSFNSMENFNAEKMKGRLDDFYRDLTKYINVIKQSFDEFQQRVQQLLDDNADSRSKLAERSFLYRVDGDIETALKESVGAAARKEAESFSSMISETIMDKFLSQALVNNLDIQENFHAILSGMIVDFEHFLQEDTAKNGYASLDSPYHGRGARARLEHMFENYLQQSNTYFSNEIRNASASGSLSTGFKLALDNFSKRIGLGVFTEGADIEARQKALDKQLENMKLDAVHGNRNYIAKRLNELNFGNLVTDNKYIKMMMKTDQRHGTMYEAIQTILHGALSSQGHPATDTIDIGSIIVRINDEAIRNEIMQQLNEITEEIKKTEQGMRKTRQAMYTKELQEINNSIKEKSKALYEKLKPFLEQEKKELFIFHDSLKLYAHMEEHLDSGESLMRKASEFEGRKLNALNAVDLLYSMDDGSNMTSMGLLERNALAGAMLNLSNEAVGHGEKATISNYLSIFVGMIMFSDITNMAAEIGQQVQQTIANNDATHIHLYQLNDTYVPGSMVLTYIYAAMTKLGQSIDVSSFAQVHISTYGADQAIKTYENERKSGKRTHYTKDWEEIANKVSQGTQVKITFMGNFLNLIQQIGAVI